MTTISARSTLSRFIGPCAFLALIAAGSAQAATIPVTSFLDNGVNCTLRKAILNANAGGVVPLGSGTACAAGSPSGGNVIVLGTGTYLFDLAPANGLPAGSFDQFDLVNNNITIQGNGPANTIIDGQEKDFIFDNFNGTTNISITLTGFTVTRGKKGPSGFDFGGMYIEDASVTLDNVAFTNNTTTASGAAVYNGNGTLTINNSTFSGNVSSGEGGAIRSTGPLVITNSTFTGNSAVRGGALYFAGNDPVGTETAAISNSTFSGNTATQMGGAISLSGSTGALGAMTLTHVTIANNTVTLAGGTGGGIYKNQSGGFNIDRSIIANNTAPTGPNCNASAGQFFNSLNYNVIGSANNCTINGTTTNNFVGAVPLNALAGNGGPTQTISLPAYSPARDRAPTCATPTDQRGSARPLGIQCDSGAFEASPTVPQAPPIGTATAGNGQASITFTASANNGGAPITGYTMTSSPSGIIGTGATSPIVVSGLTNGTAYTFTVTATNSVGTSAASAASNSVTPSGPPGAPTIGTATAGNAQASVTFTAPASNGGSPITSYTATSSPGGLTASGAASPLVVTGLTNGTAYTFTVRATNVNGQGPASAASNSVTPATVPGAPTIGTATAGNAQASVTFTAPASNGGSPIASYTVTSSPGGLTGTGATSPIVVPSLTNGTAYTFTVTATNAVGTGAASAASNSVTPSGLPGAPTIGTATAGNAQASVTFTAPASNGGSAITGYTATSSPGGFAASGAASPLVVTGLTNGTAYTFTVRATNVNGQGPASAASNSVTPATVPGAPTIGTATAGNAQASVTFTAPASNGGSAITSYNVTSSPGGLTGTGGTSPIVVPSLTNGTAYTFTVTATNAVGTGPASAASNSVTPATVPAAPTIGTATAGDAQATVTFTAPASNGGSPITSYTVTSSPGGLTGTGAASPIVVPSLTNGTAYTFTVTATNAVGTGAASAASNSVTPATVPGAPAIGTATAGNAQASVTFTAPASNGGSPITSYTVTSSPGGLTGTGAASPIVVPSLTNGTAYTFTVTATNAVGTGAASAASNSVTPATVPGAPTIGTATAGDAQATVTFTAPASDGGSAITSYTVTSSPGSLTGTGATSPIVVPSLTNGTAYTFTVTATNAVGTGPASAASNSVTPIAAVTFADVALSVTVDDPTPGLGSNVTFTIVATNLGPSMASGVQVTDLLPPGLTYVSDTPSVGTYSLATGVWNIGTIANAGSATLSLVATVSRPQALVNHATTTAQAGVDPDASNNATLIGLNGPPLADIQVQQTVDDATPGIGATVTFTLSARNAGPSSATGIELTDLLPPSLAFVTASASQGSYVAATGLWSVGAVANGATATLQITATNTSAAPVSNVAVKTAAVESDYAAGNDAASVTLNDTTPADLSLSSTASQEPVAAGTTFAYTIVVANYGPASATGVTVTDTLPAGVALVSATPSQGSCIGTTSVSCSLGTMSVGGTAEIALVVTKTTGGPVSNVATVTANEADPNNANNSHGEVTTPVELLDFQIE